MSQRLAAAGLLLLALAGCSAGILPAPAAPPKLYRLTAPHQFTGPLPVVPQQLLVDDAWARGGIDGTRIALSRSPTSLDYFGDVAWTESVTAMVQSRLIEALENSGRAPGVARQSGALRGDFLLQPEVRHFEAVYQSVEAPQVRVAIHMRLIRDADRSIVAQRLFDATATAARNDLPAIVDAFDEAEAAVLQQIVAWTLAAAVNASR